MILVIGLLVSGVVATLWLSTQATADSYKLAQAQQNTAALQQHVQSLQQQVAEANAPDALASRAQQLGMVPAGDPAHLIVGPDGSVTVIGTPAKATAPPAPPAPATTTPAAPSTPASGAAPSTSTAPTTAPTTAPSTAPTTSSAPPAGG